MKFFEVSTAILDRDAGQFGTLNGECKVLQF